MHIDIVERNFPALEERRVGQVHLVGEHELIFKQAQSDWDKAIEHALTEANSASDPVSRLNEILGSTYIFCTAAHEASDCPFAATDIVPMSPRAKSRTT